MGLSGRRQYLVVLLPSDRPQGFLWATPTPYQYIPTLPPRPPKTPNNPAHWPAHQLITKTQPELINPNCRLFRVRGQLHAQINTYLSDHFPIKAYCAKALSNEPVRILIAFI